jgi:multidrug efflux pump subunit AcrA (membrane-fusion protein)
MYGSTSLNKNKAEALLVPRLALIGSAKNPQVYVVKNDTAKLVNVSTGATYGDMLEITAGLRQGDEVVTVGQINLKDNILVKVVESSETNILTSKK